MKKFVLSLLLGFASTVSVFAQSFISQHGDTANATYTTPGDFNVDNHIKSTGGNIYLKWKLTGNNLPSGWDMVGFCDNNLCYNTTPGLLLGSSIQVSSAYSTSQWGDFHAIFNGDNAPNGSSAWIRVLASDTANGYSKTLTFIATKYPTGIVNISKSDDDIVLYPNPATSSVNVVFDASMNVKNVAIYNLIGKAVKVYKVNGNSAKMDINDIPSGIYFVRLINTQGQIVATRKFTHQ